MAARCSRLPRLGEELMGELRRGGACPSRRISKIYPLTGDMLLQTREGELPRRAEPCLYAAGAAELPVNQDSVSRWVAKKK